MKEGTWFLAEVEEDGFIQEPGSGIRVWIPVIHVWRLTEGFWKEFEEPILPGYILVMTRMEVEDVERILRVRIITHPDGSCLAMVPAVERWVRKAEMQSFFFHPETFDRRERVLVRQDARTAFAGLEGMFLGLVLWRGFHAGIVIFSLFGEMETLGAIPFDHLTHSKESSVVIGRKRGLPVGMQPFLDWTSNVFKHVRRKFISGMRNRNWRKNEMR